MQGLLNRVPPVLKFQTGFRTFWYSVLLELNASPKTASANTRDSVFEQIDGTVDYLLCIHSVLIQASNSNCTATLDQWSWLPTPRNCDVYSQWSTWWDLKSHWRYASEHACGRVSWLGYSRLGDSLLWVVSFLGLGSWTVWRGEHEQSTNIHLLLLPDWMRWDQFDTLTAETSPPWRSPELSAKINPLSRKVLLQEYFRLSHRKGN